jgi:hypothetical protein
MSNVGEARRPKAPETARREDPAEDLSASYAALHAHKRTYFRGVEYLFSEGRVGEPPLADLQEKRTRPTREFVSREAHSHAERGARVPRGDGAPLSGEVRSRLEPILGPGIGQARIHTGAESAASAKGFGARAYTVGNDVHFGAGEYKPGTREGDRLLAHELTHVVQGGGAISRKPAEGDTGDAAQASSAGGGEHGHDHEHEVSQPGDTAELEADHVADQATEALHGEGDKEKHDDHGGDPAAEKTAADEKTGKPGKPAKPKAKPKAKGPVPIQAKLEGVGRKIFRTENNQSNQPASAGGAAPAPSPNETWCRNNISVVQNLNPSDESMLATARNTLSTIRSGVTQRAMRDSALASTTAYRELVAALRAKLTELVQVGVQAATQMQTQVQSMPPRPPRNAPAAPGAQPPPATGRAGEQQVSPVTPAAAGQQLAPRAPGLPPQTPVPGAAAGMLPQLPQNTSRDQLNQMVLQRDQWLADPANQQRIDPNAATTAGIRIRGQNTEAGQGPNRTVSGANAGHIMATNTQTGAHSSFAPPVMEDMSIPAGLRAQDRQTPQQRQDVAQASAAANMPFNNAAGGFRSPFAGTGAQQAQLMQGSMRTLSNDTYLNKSMDFDFTLRRDFMQAARDQNRPQGPGQPNAMAAFDQSIDRSRTQQAQMASPNARPADRRAMDFSLGTFPVDQTDARPQRENGTVGLPTREGMNPAPVTPENPTGMNPAAANRISTVTAATPGATPGAPEQQQTMRTVQAQNCGTDLMRRLLRLGILNGTDLAMLGADQEGNFLPNCDLTPQQLADHLRWKQAMWVQSLNGNQP